jgi:hypothetical protein
MKPRFFKRRSACVFIYTNAEREILYTKKTKALHGQTRKHCCGNICYSRCFLKCFHVCPPVETLLRKQSLLPGKQKCFLSETFDVSLCFSLMFPSVCPLWETLAGNNVSATMFPSLPSE